MNLNFTVHNKAGKRASNPSEPVHFKHAAVSSDHHLCSEIGKGILKKGGSAVDSVIAVQFCVEVVNSHSTGIGGGGFMLVFDKKTGKTKFKFRLRSSLYFSMVYTELQNNPQILKYYQNLIYY